MNASSPVATHRYDHTPLPDSHVLHNIPSAIPNPGYNVPLSHNVSLFGALHTVQPLYLGAPLLVTEDGCDGLLCLNLWHPYYNVTNTSQEYVMFSPGYNWQVLLLLVLVVAGVMGNVLVCIAITVEAKLQNVTNYFLLSLAVADLFVCIIIMPFSIVNELMGKLVFNVYLLSFSLPNKSN